MTIRLLLLTLTAWFLSYPPSSALTLKMPGANAKGASGQTLPVAVDVGNEVNLRRLQYYWYRIDEEPLASHQANPAPFTPSQDGSRLAGTVMYGTTKFFLEHFGLQDITQLPPLREFKELGEAEQALLPMQPDEAAELQPTPSIEQELASWEPQGLIPEPVEQH